MEVISKMAIVTSSWGLNAATDLNDTQDSYKNLPGGSNPCLGCVQTDGQQ